MPVQDGYVVVTEGDAASVSLGSGGYVQNYGYLSGAYGVCIAGGLGTVLNAGSLVGSAGDGVQLLAGGVIINLSSALLSGSAVGVYVAGGYASVTNAGTISGGSGSGLQATDGATLANAGGGVVTGALGFYVSGGYGALTNSGAIDGSLGAGVMFLAGGTLTNQAGGTVQGATYGVALTAGGSVTNQAGGLISGATGLTLSGGAGFVINAGDIEGSSGAGAELAGGGDLGNQGGATIGGVYGVVLGAGGGTLETAGTITGTGGTSVLFTSAQDTLVVDQGAVFNGIVDGGGGTLCFAMPVITGVTTGGGSTFQDFSVLQVSQAGAIEGASFGIREMAGSGVILSGTYGTVVNSGRITGQFFGVDLYTGGTLTNQGGGVIAAAQLDGVSFFNQSGSVLNAGRITGGFNGVACYAGGQVTNAVAGVISGNNAGVYAGGYGTPIAIVNAGAISGTYFGVELGAGLLLNEAGATISGNTGVKLNGPGTIENAGTISAATARLLAVSLAYSDDTLVVDAGAVFVGSVKSNQGTLVFGTSDGSGVVSGLANFRGFATIDICAGQTWQTELSVNSTIASSTSLFVFGTLAVAGGSGLVDNGIADIAGSLTGQKSMRFAGLILSGGTVASGIKPRIEIGTTGTAAVGVIAVNAGASIVGYGTLGGGNVVDNGSITASGGNLCVVKSLLGTGTAFIAGGATLTADSGLSVASVAFSAADGTLAVMNALAASSTLSGFTSGDMVDLLQVSSLGISTATIGFAGGMLTIRESGRTVARFKFAGTYAAANFALSADQHGGTDIAYVPMSGLRQVEDLATSPAIAMLTEHGPADGAHDAAYDRSVAGTLHPPSSAGLVVPSHGFL